MQMDKSIFFFFFLFDFPFFPIYVASCFVQFWSCSFWFSVCFPVFCIFSSLKIIRISFRGEDKATWFDFGEKLVLTFLIKKHWDLTSKNWNWLDIISDVTSKLEDLTMSDVSLTNTVHWVDLMVKMAEKASFFTNASWWPTAVQPISDYSCNHYEEIWIGLQIFMIGLICPWDHFVSSKKNVTAQRLDVCKMRHWKIQRNIPTVPT